ncbi:MAG: hypothetical protein HZA48_06790 [Planctomycetes bacterium]|nr:hypothetical protein [Planctomycetota bacterium]
MDENITITPAPQDKSVFVTVIAWIFIVDSVYAVIVGLLQSIMFAMMEMPTDQMRETFNEPQARELFSATQRFVMLHMELLFFLFWIAAVVVLICSIGLLKRKNWARISFIIILAIGICWCVFGIFLTREFAPVMPFDPEIPDLTKFNKISIAIRLSANLMALAHAILFGWIIYKLNSKDIRREFGRKV